MVFLFKCCRSADAVVETAERKKDVRLSSVDDEQEDDKLSPASTMNLTSSEDSGSEGCPNFDHGHGLAVGHKKDTSLLISQDMTRMTLPIPADSLADALGFLPSTELSRLLPISRSLHEAGATALPAVLANELRPKLPVSFVKAMDKNPNKKEYWTKFAREFRLENFVKADNNDPDDADAQDPEDTGACDDLLVAFLSKPSVRELLVDGCDPAEFATWLRENTEEFQTLSDIRRELAIFASKIFVEGELHYDEEDGEEDDPYNVLTKTGGVEGIGVQQDWHTFGCFARAVTDHSPTEHHYLMVEITSRGGKPLYLDDGTPLIMWIDGEGEPVSPVKSTMDFHSERNRAIARNLSDKIAPRCTCPDCNHISTPLLLMDHALLSSDDLLLEEPWMADKFRGCEEQCYGRMTLKEGSSDTNGLAFVPCTSAFPDPDAFEDFDADLDPCDPCGLPDPQSMDGLFEITLKAIRFDPIHGPSSVTIWNQKHLSLNGSYINANGDDAGLVKHLFVSEISCACCEEVDSFYVQLKVCNCTKLVDFSSPRDFACDPRPSSNQMWIKSFDVKLFRVDHAEHKCNPVPRSDLFAYCGLLNGI